MMQEHDEKTNDVDELFKFKRSDLLDTDDLVRVNKNHDIIDADEDGSLDSLTSVSEEDVMGSDEFDEELFGEAPLEKKKEIRYKLTEPIIRSRPYIPPEQLSGLR